MTALLANDPNEVGHAVADLNTVVGDVHGFVAENRESLGTTSDKLASITQALTDSLDDIKQTLHVAPTTFQNFVNIYSRPGRGDRRMLAVNNFTNPITFICGAMQAASRLGAEQSAKLCVQYLAPIIKNRQYNFPPIGFQNLFVGARRGPTRSPTARTGCGRTTFRRSRRRPHRPPAGARASPHRPTLRCRPRRRRWPTNPADGLPGMMVPPGAGS